MENFSRHNITHPVSSSGPKTFHQEGAGYQHCFLKFMIILLGGGWREWGPNNSQSSSVHVVSAGSHYTLSTLVIAIGPPGASSSLSPALFRYPLARPDPSWGWIILPFLGCVVYSILPGYKGRGCNVPSSYADLVFRLEQGLSSA